MNKKLFLVVFAIAITFTSLNAAKKPPFLITGMMPHYTMDIKNNWNNKELALNETQKEKLLVVRKDTMTSVISIKKQIAPLEKEVSSKIISGSKPSELMGLVEKIAELKADATKAHLSCLYRTQNILSKEQLKVLTKLTKN
ncbi:Spy/CpxP family protein refolding chaperone [Arcobacter sp. LA11]|uniref:Spy/CpxP family protein refolding chaperone n=1 Tax=Arcobacter sp. LA11 TaxID=1898176 RepID=UPI0009F88282|nr:hypothetical protein [Arcobacter sp. LA11]